MGYSHTDRKKDATRRRKYVSGSGLTLILLFYSRVFSEDASESTEPAMIVLKCNRVATTAWCCHTVRQKVRRWWLLSCAFAVDNIRSSSTTTTKNHAAAATENVK